MQSGDDEEEIVPTYDPAGELLSSTVNSASDDEDPDESWATASMSIDEMWSRRQGQRPNIDWMDDAIDWGCEGDIPTFKPKKGDYVVIERLMTSFPNKPWLDTQVYRLTENPDPVTGRLWLSNPVRQQQAMCNWKLGIIEGYTFKIPPRGRNPETIFQSTGKVRRRRKIIIPKEESTDTPKVDSAPRKRGRPKGSKNRSKEIVADERKLRMARIAERRAMRKGRRMR